jgi:hypothetical protein
VFKTLFVNWQVEETEVYLNEEVGEDQFSLLLDYMYAVPFKLDTKEAFPLLVLANKYVLHYYISNSSGMVSPAWWILSLIIWPELLFR